MRNITALLMTAMIIAAGTTASFAVDYTKGIVKKVDAKAGKVTIIHEALTNLEMPAMTMVFVVADKTMLEKMKDGTAVEFVADRVQGKLTVTQLK